LKCLHGFTRIRTENGWEQIQHVVSKRYQGKVAAVDAFGNLVWAKITNYYRSPLAGRKLIKLELESSRQGVRPAGGIFTEDHEVLTQNGYKPICELDPKQDRIHSGSYQPSTDVRQAITGMLLGDSRFSRKNNSFSCVHSSRQLAYIQHKKNLLGDFASPVTSFILHLNVVEKDYEAVRFHCPVTPYFRSLGKLFYPDGGKVISAECLKDFGIISLAYLFMDDGYLRIRPDRSPLAEIATCCFSRTEAELLLDKIKELTIGGYIVQKQSYPRIHFDVENTVRLSRLIAPYVPEAMNYKLLPEHREISKQDLRTDVEPFFDRYRIVSVADAYTKHCRTVYCIDVERYGNFITSSGVVHNCRPPNNRTPLVTEADNCREYLETQLDLIRPKYICALGACAAQNLLKSTQSIGKMRKRFFDFKGIPVICTYHPAYLLRTPEAKKHVWDDMKMLLARMGRPIPTR
jgi:uracil-DNA glycosylase family 4